MDRREAMRLLAASAALPLVTPKLWAVFGEARAVLATGAAQGILNPHQNLTVTAIADMIIPKTDTPGATDVGVPAFIDLIVSEWYTDRERAVFLNGLADVDERAQHSFHKNFVACPAEQREEILVALGEQMLSDGDSLHHHPRAEGAPEAENNFYHMIRGLILTGYYTSEAGATAELNFQIIPDRYDGCADLRAGKEAAEKQ
jgi:gluconate 2-dehydrogenase gamma chain